MRIIPLIAVLSIPFIAQLRPPPPTPGKTAQGNQQKADSKRTKSTHNDQAPNNNTPRVDKPAPQTTSRNQQQTTAPRSDKAPPEWWLIASTILSAIAGIAIAVTFTPARVPT